MWDPLSIFSKSCAPVIAQDLLIILDLAKYWGIMRKCVPRLCTTALLLAVFWSLQWATGISWDSGEGARK